LSEKDKKNKNRCVWLIEQTTKVNWKKNLEFDCNIDPLSFFLRKQMYTISQVWFSLNTQTSSYECLSNYKNKRKGKKRLPAQFAYLLDWTSYKLYSLFSCFFPSLSLSFSFGNYIEDTTWERKTPWRTNFDRLLIESNFLIVVMRARERTTWKTSSVCDQLLNLNCKMMVTRTHRSSTILLE
jgi:hypothetical protein